MEFEIVESQNFTVFSFRWLVCFRCALLLSISPKRAPGNEAAGSQNSKKRKSTLILIMAIIP